jgi:hypothetical protein
MTYDKDLTNDIESMKIEHENTVHKYIQKLKDNDLMVQEKMMQFDDEKKEFFQKLNEFKESLKLNNESQINNEKSELKFKTDE